MSAPDPTPSGSMRRVAWLVALAALLVHAGLGMAAPKGVWAFEPINYDDPQVMRLVEQTSTRDLIGSFTYYAYKPVYFLSLKADRLLPGDPAAVGHVVNWLLHALCAFLLVRVLHAVLKNLWVAGAAGLLWAVHPVHVESVAWIAERKDVLSLAFCLVAHLAYRRTRERGGVPWGAAALLALAGLTKGTAWTYGGVLVIDEAIEGSRWPDAMKRLAPAIGVAIGGVLFDLWVGITQGPGAVDHGVPRMALAAAMAGVHLAYLLSVVAPVGLSLDYAVDPAGSWARPGPWIGLALAVGAVVLLVVSWRKRRPLPMLASALWILGLAPVNNVFPKTSVLQADRYLLLPAVGVYLLVALAMARARGARAVVLGAAAVLLGLLAWDRTRAFADSETVWADATAKVPSSSLAWIQRGVAAAARGEHAYALQHADRALATARRPVDRVRARLLRCDALLLRAKREGTDEARALLDEANEAIVEAAELASASGPTGDPAFLKAEAQVRRGNALHLLGDPASALDAYRLAAQLDPRNYAARFNQGTLLATSPRPDVVERAVHELREALAIDPGSLDAALQLATVLLGQGKAQDAAVVLDRAETRHGRVPDVLFARAQWLLVAKNDVPGAQRLLAELRAAAPGHAKAARQASDLLLDTAQDLLEKGRQARDRKLLLQAIDRFDAAKSADATRWEPDLGAGDALLVLDRFREARERYRLARDRAKGAAWIDALAARTGILEAAYVAHHAADEPATAAAARLDAAKRVASVLKDDVPRIDLGFLALESEVPLLRRVAARFERGEEPWTTLAGAALRAAALAVTGDTDTALAEVRSASAAMPASGADPDVEAALLLLRGLLQEQARDFEGARAGFALLAETRPGDPLPVLRGLELDFRVASARWQTAQGSRSETERLEAAAKAFDEAVRRLVEFADAQPDSLEAGLLAVEGLMQRQEWVEALRRLNLLAERHPGSVSVERGRSAVYVAQYLASPDRSQATGLLEEADRALRKALTLDPRDARTAMDASGVARIARNRAAAIRYARQAQVYESGGGGPASRTLATLIVDAGRDALQAANGDVAKKAAEEAKVADPTAALPWILDAEIELARKDLNAALKSGRRAKELEPASLDVDVLLAKVHRQRGMRALQEWTRRDKADKEGRAAARAMALEELREAIRLDPEGEDAETVRNRIASLEDSDPDARRRAAEAAEKAFERGKELLVAEKRSEALAAFQEAVSLDASHVRAQFYSAKTAAELLGPLGDDPLESRYTTIAFKSLQSLDGLDPADRFPLRHYYRGFVNEWLHRRHGSPEAKVAAARAYERFVAAMEASGKAADGLVADARRRLGALAGK